MFALVLLLIIHHNDHVNLASLLLQRPQYVTLFTSLVQFTRRHPRPQCILRGYPSIDAITRSVLNPYSYLFCMSTYALVDRIPRSVGDGVICPAIDVQPLFEYRPFRRSTHISNPKADTKTTPRKTKFLRNKKLGSN